MGDKPRFSTLFILGLGHSGSTLLGRMLACHPDVAYPGELLRLEQALNSPEQQCFCGELVSECAAWRQRVQLLPQGVKEDCRHWDLELLDRVRTAEGKAVLVDSSKSRVLRLKSKWRSPQVGYVLLVRDPRGAMRTALKQNKDLSSLLKTNRKWMRRYEVFARNNPQVCLTMFYEDLVSTTERELRRLCEFVGLNFSEAMLHPNEQPFHLIRASRSPFLKGAGGFKLDERWRSELTPGQIRTIEHQLGGISIYKNRYGFSRPTIGESWKAFFTGSVDS